LRFDTNQKLLTTKQVAAVLGLSPETVASWRRRKQFLNYVRMGSRIFYQEDDVNALARQRITYVQVVKDYDPGASS
jgi:predicted DNA-binding transcriptional regulator AlpA